MAASSIMQASIRKVMAKTDLSREEAFAAMDTIMSGQATHTQIGALLAALVMKGECAQEVAGFAEGMLSKATKVVNTHKRPVVDIVGTGGDGKHTINVSTLASFVVAGAGVPVAKHCNRSVSSKCGAADVLMALGIDIDLTSEQMSQCLTEAGIAFLFAPKLHVAMKHAVGPRRELGVRTVFNILGPITNPAGVKHQVIGVYNKNLLTLLANVLLELGAERIMLVHSADGMDEIGVCGSTYVAEVRDGKIHEFSISPADFGLPVSSDDEIVGGDPQQNAVYSMKILEGMRGPMRDVVVANAAAGLYVAGAADSLKEAAQLAERSLDEGKALNKLVQLRELTQRLKREEIEA